MQAGLSLVLVLGISSAAQAWVQHGVPAGAGSKKVGIESSQHVEEAFAALYNPARIGVEGRHSSFAFDFARIQGDYQYQAEAEPEEPQQRPYQQDFYALGLRENFGSERFDAALVIFPSTVRMNEQGALASGGLFLEDTERRDRILVMKAALGLSYRWMDRLWLGASVLQNWQRRSHRLEAISYDYPLNFQEIHVSHQSYVAGLFGQYSRFSYSLSFTPRQQKPFAGTERTLRQMNDIVARSIYFEPERWSLGATYALKQVLQIHFNTNRRAWSQANGLVFAEDSLSQQQAMLMDVWESALSLDWDPLDLTRISLGWAYLPTYWGSSLDAEGDLELASRQWLRPAELGALNRQIYSLSLALREQNSMIIQATGAFHQGHASLSQGAFLPGDYHFQAWMLSLNAEFRL